MAAAQVLDGSLAHYVHIRWHQDITPEHQQDLEWQHGLRRRSVEGRSYEYAIVNESSWNIRALRDNPFVEDSQDLDRGRSAMAESASAGGPRNGWAWRWGLEGYLPEVTTWARRLLPLGVLILLCSRPVVPLYMPAVRLLLDVRRRRRRRAVGIGLAVAGGALLWIAGPILRGAPSPTVVVRWDDGVSPNARDAREARYHLREQFDEGDTLFSYDLIDDSAATVRAIAADQAIVSIEGIDRARGVVLPTAPPGRSRTGLAWRWGWEAQMAPLDPAGGLLLAVGLGLLLGWAPVRRVGAGLAVLASALPGRLFRLVMYMTRLLGYVTRVWKYVARARVGLAVTAVFLFTLLLRWAAVGTLGGDDHWSLWTASTFLNGDRPFREFIDPGNPLHWGVSALAQVLVGYRAIGEVGLGLLLIASGLTLSFRMSWRAGGSFVIALGLAVMTAVLIAPTKLYSYSKIFIYPLGIWLAWRYIDLPGRVRACCLALGVAVAFGFRHDHGAYTAVGASAAVLAAHWKNGVTDVAVSLVRVGLATILILSPYFVLIQANEGLVSYFSERIRFAAQFDAGDRRSVPFVIDGSAPPLLALAPAPVDVGVQWAADVSAETRGALETRYGLDVPAAPKAGGWHSYFMTDYSEGNLVALFSEAKVASVDGIQGSLRQGFAIDEQPDQSAGPGIVVVWQGSASAAEMAAAERRYRLRRRPGMSPVPSNEVHYDIDDPSVSNVTALKQDDLAVKVLGIHFIRVPVAIGLKEPVPVGPHVSVRWVEAVTPAERSVLEGRFKLRGGRLDDQDPQKSFRVYELADQSDANVAALVRHSRIASVDQLTPGQMPGTFKAKPWTAPRGAQVSVIWKAKLPDAERRTLEQRYQLVSNFGQPAMMTAYRLMNASPGAIRTLASDPNVVALRGVDSTSGRVTGDTWFTAMGRRFAVMRLLPVPRLFHKANAGVWLYYVVYLLPMAVLVLLLWDWWRGRPAGVMPGEAQKMFAVAVLMAVANLGLLRKMGYFPDHFDSTAVMAAWLLGRAFRAEWRRPAGAAAWGFAVVLVAVSTVAASAYVDLPTLAVRYDLFERRAVHPILSARKLKAFSTSPPIDFFAPRDSVGDRAVVRYLYECTQPEDRIFVTSDSYAVPYYTQRRVVGHVFWANGFMANDDFERRMIELMERDPVPLVFGVGGERALDNLNLYPRVREYVAKRYTEHHAVLQDNLAGTVLWLLVDSRRTPTSTYSKLGLPCFR